VTMRARPQEHGFTLIEILIGLTISALIMVGLNQSMSVMNRSFEQATVSVGRQATIANGLHIVSGDISRIMRRVDDPERPLRFLFSGKSQEVIYLLEERPQGSLGGLYWVRLFIQQKGSAQELVRVRQPFMSGESLPVEGNWTDEVTLISADVSYAFFYRAPRSGHRDWMPDWITPNWMPEQFRIDIVDKKTSRLRVPSFVQTLKLTAEADCTNANAPACTLQSSGLLAGAAP
jgi:general secretion pathway protein J